MTEKGQIGNRTRINARKTMRIVSFLLDYVVSNLKDANFESGPFDNIGSSLLGYFDFNV